MCFDMKIKKCQNAAVTASISLHELAQSTDLNPNETLILFSRGHPTCKFEPNLLQPDCIYILFIVSEKCFIILIISNSSEDLNQSLQEIRVLTPEMKLISASFFPLL